MIAEGLIGLLPIAPLHYHRHKGLDLIQLLEIYKELIR
jgi:hypothetical protein